MIKTLDGLARTMLAGKPLGMPVIDIHAHMGDYSNMFTPHCDGAGLIPEMDRVGVAIAAISANAAFGSDMCAGNDQAAHAVSQYPKRLLGYAVANPHYGDILVDELKRCFDELSMRMIKLHPGTHEYPLTGKMYEKAYMFAEERGAPILTHTWEGDVNCSAEQAAEAARRHPGITFLWGHSCAIKFEKALELAVDLPNVYLELACSQVFNGQVEHFLDLVPPEKVVFGSDFSFLSLPQQVAKVVFADVPEGAKRKLLYDNAERILTCAGINVAAMIE